MTHGREQISQLPEHVRVSPDQLQPSALPQIERIGLFSGEIGIRSTPESALRMSILGISAADVTQAELKDHIGAVPNTKLGLIIDTVYDRLGMTSPEAVYTMVARGWQRGLLYPYKSVSLPAEASGLTMEALPAPILRILGALSLEYSLGTIQNMPEFAGVPVAETLLDFQRSAGIRTVGGAISLGFLTGDLQPRNVRPLVQRPQSTPLSPALTRVRKSEQPKTDQAVPPPAARPKPRSYAGWRTIKIDEEPTPGFTIPAELQVLKQFAPWPKDIDKPVKLEAPLLDGPFVCWGGGVFRVELDDDKDLAKPSNQAGVLQFFDAPMETIMKLININRLSQAQNRMSKWNAAHGVTIRNGQSVGQLFDERQLRVEEQLPLIATPVYRHGLEALKHLRYAPRIPAVADALGTDMAAGRNLLTKTYREFGVSTARSLVMRAFGMGLFTPLEPVDPAKDELVKIIPVEDAL